jgi:hypothetical protein
VFSSPRWRASRATPRQQRSRAPTPSRSRHRGRGGCATGRAPIGGAASRTRHRRLPGARPGDRGQDSSDTHTTRAPSRSTSSWSTAATALAGTKARRAPIRTTTPASGGYRVRDHSVLQRADNADTGRRATHQLPGVVPGRKHTSAPVTERVEEHHRRLVQDDLNLITPQCSRGLPARTPHRKRAQHAVIRCCRAPGAERVRTAWGDINSRPPVTSGNVAQRGRVGFVLVALDPAPADGPAKTYVERRVGVSINSPYYLALSIATRQPRIFESPVRRIGTLHVIAS